MKHRGDERTVSMHKFWTGRVEAAGKEKQEYIEKHMKEELLKGVPLEDLMLANNVYTDPCAVVQAPLVKDADDCLERLRDMYEVLKEKHADFCASGLPFVELAKIPEFEKFRKQSESAYDCERCPLNRALIDGNGEVDMGNADPCAFPGPLLGKIKVIPRQLAAEALVPHDPEDMLAYAQCLEEALEELVETNALTKVPYAVYAERWQRLPERFKEHMRTEEDYESMVHPTIRLLNNAIHWLRTMAAYDIQMHLS